MKNKLLLTLCLLVCFTTLSACSHDGDNRILLPWEKEDSSMGSVSDKTVIPTTPEQDDSLPYWIIPVDKDGESITYIEDEDRKMFIENAPETYKMLKEAAWNSEDPDVLTNGNIETLVETLRKMKSADRPHTTYSQMKVAGLCEHLDQYLGDCMWWNKVTIHCIGTQVGLFLAVLWVPPFPHPNPLDYLYYTRNKLSLLYIFISCI